MTRKNAPELHRLAQAARMGETAALRQFKDLARANGYRALPGGWVYLGGRVVCQGWRALADAVESNRIVFAQPLPEQPPTPTPQQDVDTLRVLIDHLPMHQTHEALLALARIEAALRATER